MATYEVYEGGARAQNASFAMFPSATFAADAVIQPAVRQKPLLCMSSRDLDFGRETSLIKYIASLTVPLASGDKLGSIIIPANFVAIGFYWKVATVVAGGTFAAGTRIGGTSLVTATTTGTLNSAYVAWPSAPVLFKTSDVVDITFGTVPAGGLGALELQVGVLGYDMRIGQY